MSLVVSLAVNECVDLSEFVEFFYIFCLQMSSRLRWVCSYLRWSLLRCSM